MRVYTDMDDARREYQLSEIQIHLSERLNSTFTRDDILCLLVNTFYSENKETIQLSNELYHRRNGNDTPLESLAQSLKEMQKIRQGEKKESSWDDFTKDLESEVE